VGTEGDVGECIIELVGERCVDLGAYVVVVAKLLLEHDPGLGNGA
jgi:hypothetical protein